MIDSATITAPAMIDPTQLELSEGKSHNGNHDHHFLQPAFEDPRPLSPVRPRPWSSQGNKPSLSPSPTFIEDRKASKDDLDISGPATPKRPNLSSRGLSLQMPPRDFTSTSTANLTRRVPVSPKLDSSSAYPSPTSVLPRRSRGLDFSRAATSLHHSILADHPSPESSPSVLSRRSVNGCARKGFQSPPETSILSESPRNIPGSGWSNIPNTDRGLLSSSVGSSAICEADSDSSSSDDMMDLGEDDTIHMTPNLGSNMMNPFGASVGDDSGNTFAPAASKLLSYQRARLQSRRSRTRGSSSSASIQSNLQSPVPPSPPIRSMEANLALGINHYVDEPMKKALDSRRESLSLGTRDMRLSDAEQSGDENHVKLAQGVDGPVPSLVNSSMEERKQVVRRAVSRRGNLLPKSKGFARIKAALIEEGSPLDAELRQEAQVIKQVRDNDVDSDLNFPRSQQTTTASSPCLGPIINGPTDIENFPIELTTSSEDSSRRQSTSAFTGQAAKNSAGPAFWNNFDDRMRTPPPVLSRAQSTGLSDDVNMDTTQSSTSSVTPHVGGSRRSVSHESSSSTPQTMVTTTFDVPRKGNKRMREDDFDPTYFKRRAVSPSLSVQNSPILPQSPGWWGTPKRDERISSNGSAGSGTGIGKRVGMQGMNDTNDSLMNMSIE